MRRMLDVQAITCLTSCMVNQRVKRLEGSCRFQIFELRLPASRCLDNRAASLAAAVLNREREDVVIVGDLEVMGE